MTKQKLIFVTSNKHKIIAAESAFRKRGLGLDVRAIDIDEIQHHDPIEITKAKVRSVYDLINQPVIVHDSNWAIPALNGFPGGYMKDVIGWFESEDFLNLIRGKEDKSINLIDTVAYFDGKVLKTFSEKQDLEFIEEPRGRGVFTLDPVVKHKNEDKTIAEMYDLHKAGDEAAKNRVFQVWKGFLDWYDKSILVKE
ncbi:hypothetical protein CR969_02900 [Candidatus Saccharibacteria bacterium]|nr:MAG: hypothetical protein CR969_02900 [Candidatus Saccharibacteria bacterium]